MNKKPEHSIDKLFYESLNGNRMEPGASVWKSLSGHIPAKSGAGSMILLASAVAIGIFAVLLSYQLHIFPGQEKQDEQDLVTTIADPQNKSDALTQPPGGINDNTETDNTNNLSAAGDIKAAMAPEADIEKVLEKPTRLIQTEKTEIISAKNSEPRIKNENIRTRYPLLRLKLYRYGLSTEDLPAINENNIHQGAAPSFNMGLENTYVKNSTLVLGAGFSPAVNIYPEGQNRNDYSLELIAAYEKSRVIIEGGVGVNYATESARYGITWSTYDSVGYFINVNSFIIDPENPEAVRFQTSMKNIYDSISHYRIQENTNKYAYLQIPLRLGYRMIEHGRFSLDLKAGIIFSWQILKDVPEAPYQGNDADQIEVIRHYPDRLKTNWQYTAGFGINYHFSKQLRLSIEPFYRQYLQSVYSTNSVYSARSPYAFGLRGGIYIEF
ncbi:MAG: hypothetical protein RQ761_06040 [Bacteroidales bacterium]|nr:hypothetical protein [Bacteroidales bacterium]